MSDREQADFERFLTIPQDGATFRCGYLVPYPAPTYIDKCGETAVIIDRKHKSPFCQRHLDIVLTAEMEDSVQE